MKLELGGAKILKILLYFEVGEMRQIIKEL